MKLTRSVTAGLIAIVLALYPAMALAAGPIKHSSQYGKESAVQNWNLFGPTDLVSFSGLKMSMQVRCVHQDVEGVTGPLVTGPPPDPTKVGGCDMGANLFLFQIPSGPKNLEVTFSHLVNFTFNDDLTPVDSNGDAENATVGVMRCDLSTDSDGTPPNTAGLCTTVMPLTPAKSEELSDITIKHKGNTEVTFLIPKIPNFPSSGCVPSSTTVCHEGHGLTLFLLTNDLQSNQSVIPLAFPTVTVKTDSDLD